VPIQPSSRCRWASSSSPAAWRWRVSARSEASADLRAALASLRQTAADAGLDVALLAIDAALGTFGDAEVVAAPG
jgi:hypothetical protein